MVDTIKFSEMTAGGDLANNEKVPGLLGGANVLFNNPWTFLPPGNTADRPVPSSLINYRLRFNTDDKVYEFYDSDLGVWTQLQDSEFIPGPFVTYTADPSLPDAQNLGLLANGILKQTVTSLEATLDIAANGIDYFGPGVVIPGEWGGTGIDNTGLTLDLSGGIVGYILTSDSSGNATWQPNGYLTDAVLLNPSSNQTILNAFNLIMDAGSLVAPTMLPGNLSLTSNVIASVNANGNISLIPNGTGSILSFTSTVFNSIYSKSLQSTLPIAVGRFTGATPGTNSGQFMGFASTSTGPGVFSAIAPGDPMARLVAYGDDGSAFREAGLFQFSAISVSPGIVSANALLYTTNPSGVRSLGMEISNTQIANFSQMVTSGANDSGAAGTFLGYSPTALMGSTALVAANNAGNYANVLTNTSTSSARTWTLPDATGTIALTSSTVATANNLAGGTANDIPYQTGIGTTAFITETANGVLVYSAGGVPSSSTTLPSGLTATNMNLITPTLGVSSATSINFGQDALNYYDEGTFTPTVTPDFNGDWAPNYVTQTGIYTRIGRMVYVFIKVRLAPTWTTALTYLKFGSLPFNLATASVCGGSAIITNGGSLSNWGAGFTTMSVSSYVTTSLVIFISGSAKNTAPFGVGEMTSGATIEFTLSAWYIA